MDSSDILLDGLNVAFPAGVQALIELPDNMGWSVTYRVILYDGTVFYLKGTPRARSEAPVTAYLYDCVPYLIPRPLALDLLPASNWQWFVLEDVGNCDRITVEPEIASEIVNALAQLQRRLSTDTYLKTLLPDCSPDRLYSVVIEVCAWAVSLATRPAHDEFIKLQQVFMSASDQFAALTDQLSLLPPTCVHGDLFPGNMALSEYGTRFIDWADAVWGVGAAAVFNLLATSASTLANHHVPIWKAYAEGWGVTLTDTYIDACDTAFRINCLMIDMRIAQLCGHGPDWLLALLPELRRMVTKLQGDTTQG